MVEFYGRPGPSGSYGQSGLSRLLAAAAPPSPLLTDLKAWYKMDELESGEIEDSHGGFTLTDNNTVGYSTGVIGDAVNVVGARSEYLSQADKGLWPHPSVSSSSLSFWIKTASTAAGIIGHYNAGTDNILIFQIGGVPQGLLYNAVTGQTFGALCGAINDNAWHHLVVTYDITDGKMTGYLDDGAGTVATTSAAANFGESEWAFPFELGRHSGGNYLTGDIDLFGIWGRILTSDERTELNNSGAGKDYPFS